MGRYDSLRHPLEDAEERLPVRDVAQRQFSDDEWMNALPLFLKDEGQ